MQMRKFVRVCVAVMGLGMVCAGPIAHADDEEKAPTKGSSTETVAALEKEWDQLIDRRNKISKKIQLLEAEFDKATAKRKTEIQEEYAKLVTEFQKGSMTRMEQMLPTLAKAKYPQFIKDPEDEKSKAIIEEYLQMNFHGRHRYEEVASFGQKLIAAGRTTPLITNLTGAALFNTNQFEKAIEVLKKAEKDTTADGRELFERIGVPFLTQAQEYLPQWQKEQGLRKQEAEAPKEKQNPHVLLKTTKGDIEIELFENQAPNTVANFISLVEKGKYDGVGFHRVIPTFMAQGGDPNTLDDNPKNDGGGGPGYTIKCECVRKDARWHYRGSLSMAHAGRDTGGSQFFLTYVPTAHLNLVHTCFGRVVKGMDVASSFAVGEPVPQDKMDKIISAKVLSKRDHDYVPVTAPDARSGGK
ncbi:MAG: peptidylprolyl isomerase [Planctomycetales bacterium]